MNKIIFFLIALLSFQSYTFAQYTSIPDDNFEQALIDAGIDPNPVLDDQILTSLANAHLGDLDIANNGILDLTGIEAFVNITGINFNYNTGITSVDLSNCTSLITVNGIGCTDLTSVNVTGLLSLTTLDLRSCGLLALDVTSNVALKTLNVRKNNIASLDLSDNLVIDNINVKNNPLTYMDLRNGNCANMVYYVGDYTPCLKCMFVDDTSDPNLYDHAYWIFDDLSTLVETEAECDLVPSIDPVYCPTLSLDEFDEVSFGMYPNPANASIHILTTKTDKAKINIYNITGKIILTKELFQGDNLIDVSGLATGIYLARFVSDNKMDTKKLIIN